MIGEVRDKHGNYYGLVPDTYHAFKNAGMDYYNEAILCTSLETTRKKRLLWGCFLLMRQAIWGTICKNKTVLFARDVFCVKKYSPGNVFGVKDFDKLRQKTKIILSIYKFSKRC